MDAALPGAGLSELPESAWQDWLQGASGTFRWGFRATVWSLTWAPSLRHGRPFHRLPADTQDAILQRLAARRDPLSVQLTLALKVMVGLASEVPR